MPLNILLTIFEWLHNTLSHGSGLLMHLYDWHLFSACLTTLTGEVVPFCTYFFVCTSAYLVGETEVTKLKILD